LTSTKVVYVSAEIGTGVTACASTRIPDTAIASDPPVLSVTADQSICNGAITNLSVASNLADYDTYVWSPTDSLYTNSGATTRYIAGQSYTSLYIKSTRPGKIKYTVTSSSTGCSNTTTTTVSTQLLSATITAQPASLCVNGVDTLTLVPSADSLYGVGSIQWQRSSDISSSSNWVSTAGAVGTTYYTPLQASNRYYRALVKNGAGNTCFATPTLSLTISNPQITAINNGAACGPHTANSAGYARRS
jgi:hypothetical protein